MPLFNPSSGNSTYHWDLKLTANGKVCAEALEGTGSDYDFSATTVRLRSARTCYAATYRTDQPAACEHLDFEGGYPQCDPK